MAFKFNRVRVHLRYSKGTGEDCWLDEGEIKSILDRCQKWDIRCYSWCHENGKHGDEEVGHKHTHIFIACLKKMKTENARFFDIRGIHPNWKPVESDKHEDNIVNTYHKKENFLKGTETFHERPAAGRPCLKFEKTLKETVETMGIEIKTVNDVKALFDEHKRLAIPDNPCPWTADDFIEKAPANFSVVYVHGPSNMGKTEWVKTWFKNPHLVGHMDDLRKFNKDVHDGIIFDDMSFAHMPRETGIFLADWDNNRSIHARYEPAMIPAHTRKVFTSNKTFNETFPQDEHGAIRRRFSHFLEIADDLRKDIGGLNVRSAPIYLTLGKRKRSPDGLVLPDGAAGLTPLGADAPG
jgi:hypothetical protein